MKGQRHGSAVVTASIHPNLISVQNHDSPEKLEADEWDSALPVPKLSGIWSSLIIAVAAVITFENSMDGQFVFDDGEAIINNEDLRPETSVWNLLYNDFWGTRLTHNKSHKSYRPVTVLSFRWNYWLADGLTPHGYHLTNIVLHAVVSILASSVVNRLLGGNTPRLSFLAALLFAVHPVHSEAVAGVVGRADLLCSAFGFLSILAYAQAAEGNILLRVANRPSCVFITASRIMLLFLSITFCGLALFSKEQGITVIGICSAFDILIVNKISPAKVFRLTLQKLRRYCEPSHVIRSKIASEQNNKNTTCEKGSNKSLFSTKDFVNDSANIPSLITRHTVLIITAVVFLFIRWRVMGSKPPTFQEVDNPASFAESLWTRVATYNYLYALNVWLLVCPEWLCFDWSMGCVPLLSNVNDLRLFAVAAFWITMLSVVWQGVVTVDNESGRKIGISVVMMVVPFLPASNLFFRVGFVLAERVLYLPSLGFCMLVAIGLRQLAVILPRFRKCLLVGFIALLIVFFARSVQRSSEWQNEESLFRSGLHVCPLNAKVHYNVAKNAGDLGNRELALQEYRQALHLNPKYEQAMNNLANLLKDQGKLQEAESLLRSAVNVRPDFAAAWMNLGIVLATLKKHSEAELSYLTALQHRMFYPDCYYNLGNLYLDQGRHHEAFVAWRNATRLRPMFSIAWNNMVVMLDNIGETSQAEATAKEALALLPNDAGLHFNLGNMLGKSGKFQDAEQHFLQAVDLDPHNAVYHSNMGVLYHRWKKYVQAEKSYLTAIKLKPQLKSAQENLAMLRRTMAKTR